MSRTTSHRPGLLRSARTLAAAASLTVATACGSGDEPASGTPDSAAQAAPATPEWARPVRDVLDATLAELGVVIETVEATPELRTDDGLLPKDVEEALPEPEVTDPDAGLSPDDIELRDGLVELVLAQPRMLAASLGDVEAGGDGLVAALAAGLDNPARPDEELRALVDLTSGLEDARVARSLLGVATRARSSELRGFAATALQRHLEAPDADAVLPALVKRLKYERDADVKGWIERSVQRIDAGVTASERPSDALRGELWRMVQALSGAHFQLRGVDDARFVLARLGPWAAAELALALEDDDVYVRLHSAQVLQRMAERAEPAVASLIAALYDRNDGVAGTAAEALSVVAPERAQGELLARLDDAPPYEVRVALVRALAQLPGGGPTDRLTAVFADAPGTDLRLAAARGLLAAGAEDTVLPWLVEQLARTRGGDPAGAEAHLDEWLRAGAGPEGLLERWVALGPRGEVVHSGDQVRARRAARAALFAE